MGWKGGVDGIDPETGRWDWTFGRLAFLDAESTNVWDPLDPPALLEIGVVVTDKDLTELGRYTAVIKTSKEVLGRTDPFVTTMHLMSGLWQELQAGIGISISRAEQELCRMLENTDWGDSRPVTWVGSSPGALDRPLVQRAMPTFYKMFHYRSVDVSALRLVLQNYAGIKIDRGVPAHRALDDAFGALDHLRAYKERLALLAGAVA